MARGRRRVEDPATARRILAAAEQQFASQGIEGARTDEIATAAHANKAMLYYYFGDKRRLHRAVLENLLRQFRSGVLALPVKDIGPREQFFGYVSGYFDFLASHPNYPQLVQREAMAGSRNFDFMVREYFRPVYAQLTRTIAEGVAEGEFRKVDPQQMASITMGMVTSYFASAPIVSRIAGHNLLAPQAVAARKKALMDFLKHAMVHQVRKGGKAQ
jgi:TetR/AcrR family transcriptional regulator